MSIHYAEKRNYYRMDTDSKITYKIAGTQHQFVGQCINLSTGGILFSTDQNIQPGTVMDINITPERAIVPPFDATIEVLRAVKDSSGEVTIAGQIKV